MCDPITTAVVVTGAASGVEALFSSEAAENNAEIAQSTAEYNASATMAMAEYNASATMMYAQYQAAAITANAQYQASIASTNAAIAHNAAVAAENAAISQREQAKYNAEKIRQRNRRLLGQQTAGYAKAGVDLAGSPEDVIYDSALQGEMDALMAIYTGDMAAHAYFAEATSRRYSADVYEWQSSVLLDMGAADAANTLAIGQSQADLIMYEAGISSQGVLLEGANQANMFETQGDLAYVEAATQTATTASTLYFTSSLNAD